MQIPAQPAGEREPRPGLGRTGHPAERRYPVVERCLNVRPEVEGEPGIMAAALDLIDDLDRPAAPVQPHRPVVPGRRPEPGVSVVFSAPVHNGVVICRREIASLSVPQPQERATTDRLPLPVDLHRVVPDRRLKVLPPLRFAVVAVRSRVGEDIHTAIADLYRQRVGVCVRGDGQEAVQPAVTAAPNLRRVSRVRSEDCYASIREPVRTAHGTTADLLL